MKLLSFNISDNLIRVWLTPRTLSSFSQPQTQKTSSSLSYDIHYWIGSQSTTDEQGAAALYTIQLDEFLGSTPVQHREVQNHESDAFRGYFKQGLMWVKMWVQKAIVL